jgi:histone acetyltransferase 1
LTILLAAELYKAIYQYILSHSTVAELTVEDPAEAFEDLRDRNDLRMLLSNERFLEEGFGGVSYGGGRVGGIGKGGTSGRGGRGTTVTKGKMGPPANKIWVEKWRKDLKIAGVNAQSRTSSRTYVVPFTQRQFHRLIEMLIILRLDPSDARAVRAYRLQVKERLYRFNFVRDSLAIGTSVCSSAPVGSACSTGEARKAG